MANDISDVTVNISVEDVVNPAAFGGMCLYDLVDSGKGIIIPYTEVYSVDEANTIIDSSGLKDISESIVFSTLPVGSVDKAQLNTLGNNYVTFLNNTYTVEKNTKKINGVDYTARIKAIADDNGFKVSLDKNKSISVACIGSSGGKITTFNIKGSNGIVFKKDIKSDEGEYITFTAEEKGDYTIYSTSTDGATMHIYAIEFGAPSMHARAMKNAVNIAFMQENPPEKIGLLSCTLEDFPKYINIYLH